MMGALDKLHYTQSQGLTYLEFQITKLLDKQYTRISRQNNIVDDMKHFCNCGFEFQNATHAKNVKQYKIRLDDLVQP